MIGIKQKLMLGFGGLLVLILLSGVFTLLNVGKLGGAVDTILKENYRSVLACQTMKDSLERIDSGLLFILTGNSEEGRRLISINIPKFTAALDKEKSNITLPGEKDAADTLASAFEKYRSGLIEMTDTKLSEADKRKIYYTQLYPMLTGIKTTAQKILNMNQSYMADAGRNASALSDRVFNQTLSAIIASVIIAALFSLLTHKWILRPIRRLIESTKHVRDGNYNLVLEVGSSDEIGALSEAFNEMAQALRTSKKHDMLRMAVAERSADDMLKVLPEAIAVIIPDGTVKSASETAEINFGFKPGAKLETLNMDWADKLFESCITEHSKQTHNGYMQHFVDGTEYFFQPTAMPIPPWKNDGEITAVALILKDVTQVNEQKELKKSVAATVSHQLKTPLTSLQMAVHLLLEEKAGSLTDKQTELLIEARDSSERLASIIDGLITINSAENKKNTMTACSADLLISDAEASFSADAKDRGLTLSASYSENLPDVFADRESIAHVFSNLISNAFRFTQPGGKITLGAQLAGDFVRFSVTDTGSGIPTENIKHIFDRFYRAPGQAGNTGAGLGLSIVREIVEAHGGTVSALSHESLGSEFRFTLPVFMEESK